MTAGEPPGGSFEAMLESGYDRPVETGTRRRWLVIDLAICAAMLAYMLPATLGPDEPDGIGAGTVWDSLLLPTVILPILLRRRAPFGAAVLLAAGCVVSGAPTFDQFRLAAAVPAGMLILYSLATRADRTRAVAGLALVLAGMVFIGFTDIVLEDEGGPVGMVLFSFPLCIGVWAAGRVVRSREQVAGQLRERTLLLEHQREETAALAVEVERTRLASDLDAAARPRVREMVELATRAERSAGADPDRVREAFGGIERIGREALNELRGLLGAMRSDERGERAPRPTLAELDTLLAEARAGGRLVDFEVEGQRRPLPEGVELAAYRAVQHALVAIRGEETEPALVQLRYLPAALDLEVRGIPIEGSGAVAAVAAARERVTAHGGTFSSHSDAPARRVLRAHLPVVARSG
jgi:signal transduction histidine kinase